MKLDKVNELVKNGTKKLSGAVVELSSEFKLQPLEAYFVNFKSLGENNIDALVSAYKALDITVSKKQAEKEVAGMIIRPGIKKAMDRLKSAVSNNISMMVGKRTEEVVDFWGKMAVEDDQADIELLEEDIQRYRELRNKAIEEQDIAATEEWSSKMRDAIAAKSKIKKSVRENMIAGKDFIGISKTKNIVGGAAISINLSTNKSIDLNDGPIDVQVKEKEQDIGDIIFSDDDYEDYEEEE